MTGEPGTPEETTADSNIESAQVAKRTAADAEAALRQFELESQLKAGKRDPVIGEKPLAAEELDWKSKPRLRSRWFTLRKPVSWWMSIVLGVCCILFVFAIWWFVTRGETNEARIFSKVTLPSVQETFSALPELWFERQLSINTVVTIRRVAIGFALAVLIGVPVGLLAGCFGPLRSFLAPLVIFGRNIPLAALIPLTMMIFSTGEFQKVIFIFIACVAFIIADASNAIANVGQKYVDTAYTLGATRWQTIIKVLVPLAMPSVFNSLRLLFGLAFGYIMLAEVIRSADAAGGLGNLILVSQKRAMVEHIYLIILIIPLIALAIDQMLLLVQRQLFPYRYNSTGVLHAVFRSIVGVWDDLKTSVFGAKPPFDELEDVEQTENAEGTA